MNCHHSRVVEYSWNHRKETKEVVINIKDSVFEQKQYILNNKRKYSTCWAHIHRACDFLYSNKFQVYDCYYLIKKKNSVPFKLHLGEWGLHLSRSKVYNQKHIQSNRYKFILYLFFRKVFYLIKEDNMTMIMMMSTVLLSFAASAGEERINILKSNYFFIVKQTVTSRRNCVLWLWKLCEKLFIKRY